MSLVFAVLAILVVAGAFLLASGRSLGSGRWSGVTSVERDHRPDLDGRGFDVVVRGYRMDEVDARIARLESELAQARRSARGSAAES
jgi:hypothetical protein